MSKISESGMIGPDGRLRMPMDRINAEFAKSKGKRVVAVFYVDEPGSSAAQRSYYYNYVVPAIRTAFLEKGERRSEKSVDRFLVEQYPGDKSESEIGLGCEVTEGRQLSQPQMSDFLEWLKQYAAENLQVFIDDPRVI